MTSWSALGGSGDGTGAVEIWRPTGTPNEFRLIAIGPEESFPAGTVTSHPVNIPVQPGDHLGLVSLAGDFSPLYTSASSEDVEFGAVGNPSVGQTTGAPTSNYGHLANNSMRVNAAATLSAPSPASPVKKKKCKRKKKHKRSAESAKKKKCKKRKKKH